jgi:triosephosphate isomerase
MRDLIFAGNWKMHLGPRGASDFLQHFLAHHEPMPDRETWFFAPAVSLTTVAAALGNRPDLRVGVQSVHWESKGAFTGETSVAMAAEAGATAGLVGHSERRHVFGETDQETGLKVRALLAGGLTPMLCVGERLEERERGQTLDVVRRQLGVLHGLPGSDLGRVMIAYEPVWAIGTGKNATPADAAAVHTEIREELLELGAPAETIRILYGGSVKPSNVGFLISERAIDGVLVGGASLDPESWSAIARTQPD